MAEELRSGRVNGPTSQAGSPVVSKEPAGPERAAAGRIAAGSGRAGVGPLSPPREVPDAPGPGGPQTAPGGPCPHSLHAWQDAPAGPGRQGRPGGNKIRRAKADATGEGLRIAP